MANALSMKLMMRFEPARSFCVSGEVSIRLGVWAMSNIDRPRRRFMSMRRMTSSPASSPFSSELHRKLMLSMMTTLASAASAARSISAMTENTPPERLAASMSISARRKLSGKVCRLPCSSVYRDWNCLSDSSKSQYSTRRVCATSAAICTARTLLPLLVSENRHETSFSYHSERYSGTGSGRDAACRIHSLADLVASSRKSVWPSPCAISSVRKGSSS